MSVRHPPKLIEVALPLQAINDESARRKRKAPAGYPTAIHKWWAQRPIAACRAVLFASIVDDPSGKPEDFPTEAAQVAERERLFRIIEELISWDNSNDPRVLEAAKKELARATGGAPPLVVDPFCGAGSIPLEAQRLGLQVHASDLNPVAVLITKALVEIPARFSGRAPVNAESRQKLSYDGSWVRTQGLAEDVRHYGRWIRESALSRIGHLYPHILGMTGTELVPAAWIWARTLLCPNPACGAQMPLVNSFVLSTRKGNEWHVAPIVRGRTVRFEVRQGADVPPTPKVARGSAFRCLVCGQIAKEDYVKAQGVAGRFGAQLMAIVADGDRRRIYLSPAPEHEAIAFSAVPDWVPQEELPYEPRAIWCTLYGIKSYGQLFTQRQLVALTTFSDLIREAHDKVVADGGDEPYASAIATYLTLSLSRAAHYGSSNCSWLPKDAAIRCVFARQALPMVWDFTEGNPFGKCSAGFTECVEVIARCIQELPAAQEATIEQLDADSAPSRIHQALVCTDPPYYDNIGYADLADFFYVWMRRTLRGIYPDLFSTVLTPKRQELVANPYRFDGDRAQAEAFFEQGLRNAFARMRKVQDPRFPLTLFYAFKQAEEEESFGVSSTGWDTMLTALLDSGFAVTGTWPMRTEGDNRQIGVGANALASSILLVCRPRDIDASVATRRDFIGALRAELPRALRNLQHGNIAPVDLAQAAIGPGMAVYSRYAKVLEADGSAMSVRTALALINHALDEILAEQEGELDADTRFAITWFEQRGTAEGPYGQADVLARAKNTSVRGMVDAGVLLSHAGKVRVLSRNELDANWDPVRDRRLTVWEVTQHLIHRLDASGEAAAADLLSRVGGLGEAARNLAYRLYTVAERKGWAQEAIAYNSLVVAWPEIARRATHPSEMAAQQVIEV